MSIIYINLLTIAPCSDGQIRLADGFIANEGRVEVCLSDQWGTVCDDLWGANDATVVCNQLGYSTIGCTITLNYYSEMS